MREIKFRAWDKEKKVMYEEFPSLDDFGSIQDLFEAQPHLIPMQYTGLKDKNGKEIYEGDILDSETYPFHDQGESNYLAEVCWDEEGAGFFGYMYLRKEAKERKSGIAEGNSVDTEFFPECEVIGNIYEGVSVSVKDFPPEEVAKWYGSSGKS